MPSFNRVILMGNLTDKPELRFSEAGNAWCRFTLAVNDKYKSSQGELTESSGFYDVTSFGRQAETLSRFLDKGSPLLVEGRLEHHRWESDEGQKRSRVRVVLRRFQFVDSGRRRSAEESGEADASGDGLAA